VPFAGRSSADTPSISASGVSAVDGSKVGKEWSAYGTEAGVIDIGTVCSPAGVTVDLAF